MKKFITVRWPRLPPPPPPQLPKLRKCFDIIVLVVFVCQCLFASSSSATVADEWRAAESVRHPHVCPLMSSLRLSAPSLPNVTDAYIYPDADVYFTVLLPHLACPSDAFVWRDTQIYLNAIKYALDLLNNNSDSNDSSNSSGGYNSNERPQQVVPQSSQRLSPIKHYLSAAYQQQSDLLLLQQSPQSLSLLAAIKYGARVAVTAPASDTPANLECVANNETEGHQIHDLALLDAAHYFDVRSSGTNQLLENIPIISLSSNESILTTSFKANLIVHLLEALDWKHFAIITTRHEDSLYIIKILGQKAHSGQICISDIFECADSANERSSEANRIENRLATFLRTIYRRGTKIPILVVSNDEQQVLRLTQTLIDNFANEVRHHQLFFSLVPSPELLSRLQSLSQFSTVFTLTTHLPDLPETIKLEQFLPSKQCKSNDAEMSAASASDMRRRWLSFLPIRSMLAVAIALQQTIKETCDERGPRSNERSGQPWCAQFGRLDRKVIIDRLNALHDKMESTWLSFGAIDHDHGFSDLLYYNGDQFRVSESSFNYPFESSTCQATTLAAEPINDEICRSCVKFRQSRSDPPFDPAQISFDHNTGPNMYSSSQLYGHDAHNDLHVLLNAEESGTAPIVETENVDEEPGAMLHVETHEIYVGLLLPLHQTGTSVLECSSELNLPAYYIYEAARWIIEKINQNNYLIPGIEIKLELIDTCSSPFYATQELAHLTSSEAKVQPIAFVSSLPRDHYKQVVDFVSSINYTLLATQDISFLDIKFGPHFGILQTAATGHSLVSALIEQLKYFGWRYVSVVIDPSDGISMQMFHMLSEMAGNEKICFATIEQINSGADGGGGKAINQTINRLLDNYKNGANVVVLLTNFVSSAALMSSYQLAIRSSAIRNENLHFISVRDQNLEMVHGFEEEYLGAIFIRESIGRMTHFDNHFLDLLANPKKEQLLFTFIKQCGPNSAQCLRLINSFDRTVAANTMQAILATVGGFARMRNETCAHEQGICGKMLESSFHKNLLSYILNTRSMRIDSQSDRRFKSDNYDVFEFGQDGSSARDIEILNFKHDFNNGLFRFDTVALYMQASKTLMRNPNVRYLFYKYNGVIDGHKEYNETELIASDCVNLKKCTQCEPQTPEFIYMPSWDNLLLTGIFDVHRHSAQNPLICQKNHTLVDSVQSVEAFLWTIDLINNDPNILPGVHLGALIFDTCSSYQKIYRDISNFLSNSLLLGDSNVPMPTAESVVGFVVDGQNTKIVDSILDLTNPLKLSVLASDARETKYQNVKQYPQFLSFAQPNAFYVETIIKILRHYAWSYVSVLYESSLTEQRHSDAFEIFLQKTASNVASGVRLAAKELFDESNITQNVNRLKAASRAGAKVVVVFLSDENFAKFLRFNRAIGDEQNRLSPSDVIYLTIDSQATLRQLAKEHSAGDVNVISVTESRGTIPEFSEYFFDLSLKTNLKNPWFTKLWEKVYGCEGFGCYRTSGSLRQRDVVINEKTTAVINAVYSLAHSLELIRQSMCPGLVHGLCRNFAARSRQISRLESELLKSEQLPGLDGSRITFSADSNFIASGEHALHVLNWQAKSGKWLPVGQFDAANGLTIATEKTQTLIATNGTIGTLAQVTSQCRQSSAKCGTLSANDNVDSLMPPRMGPAEANVQANIAVIAPLHHHDGFGKCGPINAEIFEKLIAFYFALDQHNQRSAVRLGMLVLDSCAFPSRQQVQQLASVQNFRLLPKIVSIVNLLEPTQSNLSISNQLFGMISDYSPLLYNLYRPKSEEQQNFFFTNSGGNNNNNEKSLTPNVAANHMLRSIVDFCSRNKWSVVNVAYANEFSKNYFLVEANQNNICVHRTLHVTLKDIARASFRDEWTQFVRSFDSQVLVVLAGADVAEYLIKYTEKQTLDRTIWLGDRSVRQGALSAQKNIRKMVNNLVVVMPPNRDESSSAASLDHVPLSSTLDALSKYFDIHNDINHVDRTGSSAMINWLHEYWHRKFNCLLEDAKKRNECFDAKHARKALSNPKELKHVLDFGKVLFDSISKFVNVRCNGTRTQSDDCIYNFNVRNELKNSLIDELNRNNYMNDIRKVNSDANYEIELLTNGGKTVNHFASYNWINVGALIVANQSGGNAEVLPINTACRSSCELCRTQVFASNKNSRTNSLLFADTLQSPLSSNVSAHRTWAIAASILSTLGLIVVLICVLYFILIFPIALGTTIIGYQILIGLFFCYLINFAYLLPSTNGLCWILEFGLPIAYCVILSGLFVKVYNYWCQTKIKPQPPPNDGSRSSSRNSSRSKSLNYNSTMTLLSMSFTFVVVEMMLAAFLTYKHPTAYGLNPQTLQCAAAGGKFAAPNIETVLPITLLVLQFILICFFALKSIDNLESRWILICTGLTAFTWLVWVGFDSIYRDSKSISIVVANLLNATIFITLLYIRKLYLFSKISRKILKERRANMDANMQYEPFADYRQQYGAFRTNSDNISWSNVHDDKVTTTRRTATRSPFEVDNEDNVSSCGSVKSNASSQVQCQELYPMEVYDNQLQSQQQAANGARVGQSSRSIYDIIDDANQFQ